MRPLTTIEERRLAILTDQSASVALLEVTSTGLTKSILDATAPVRNMLANAGVHDYGKQGLGQNNKVTLQATLHGAQAPTSTKASLYRPETKQGDPRIWIYGLKGAASPNDVIALTIQDGSLQVLNLTSLVIEELGSKQGHSIERLFHLLNSTANAVAQELLDQLKAIANRGPVPSVLDVQADTAVGRTLEAMLGIEMNSSLAPDYKGIELKAFRSRLPSRQPNKTMFAQVPDWKQSKLKSSAEILNAFGYERGSDFKLYCTVSAITRNSQGLKFKIDPYSDWLKENSSNPKFGDFAVWKMEKLRARLLEKHAETFWVSAKSTRIEGREHFQFTEVVHTRKPILSQFDVLLERGIITMDHLIKRTEHGGAREKGPLFRIKPDALSLLFPPARIYDLAA